MNQPIKEAYQLAQKMRRFRAMTESTLPDRASEERNEVVRQMDWTAFAEVVKYLEFTHLHK